MSPGNYSNHWLEEIHSLMQQYHKLGVTSNSSGIIVEDGVGDHKSHGWWVTIRKNVFWTQQGSCTNAPVAVVAVQTRPVQTQIRSVPKMGV